MTQSNPIPSHLIPQQPPMRLVEELRATDDAEWAETAAIVRESWPTVEGAHARTLVLIELIAQSAAVLVGWQSRLDGKPARLGLLVGVTHASFERPLIPVGTRLVTHVRISHGLANYRAFDGRVCDEAGTVWMEASIQAYRPDQQD